MKLEFLDISLNTWSVIVFFFYALLLMSMTLTAFGGMNSKSLLSMIVISFISYNVILVLYAISTYQVGFILMVIFQFFLTLATFMFLNQNTINAEDMGDIDDD